MRGLSSQHFQAENAQNQKLKKNLFFKCIPMRAEISSDSQKFLKLFLAKNCKNFWLSMQSDVSQS